MAQVKRGCGVWIKKLTYTVLDAERLEVGFLSLFITSLFFSPYSHDSNGKPEIGTNQLTCPFKDILKIFSISWELLIKS